MKKSRLKRKTGLERKTPLRSRSRLKRSRINPVNEERRERRYEKTHGRKADWIRGLCCLVCGHSPCDPHHWPTRAKGGTKEDLTPLCRKHHRSFHDDCGNAARFEERYGVNVIEKAAELETRWQKKTR